MWGVSRGQLPGKGEYFLSLLRGFFRCLSRGGIHIDWCGRDDGKKGLEKEVGTLGVEVHRQWSVELCGRDTEWYDGDRDGRASDLGSRVRDGAEWWKVGAVRGEDDVVGWIEGDLVATVGDRVAGLGRVHGKHVGGHLGREIVYHDGELLGKSRRCWKGGWFDASEDLVHSEEDVRVC